MAEPTQVHTAVTLPPTFSNSFWSTDYRTGYRSVYSALQAGIVQSDEILETVLARIELERLIARQLLPPALRRDGFASDDGSSLRMAFEATLTSLVGESKLRQRTADELNHAVYQPFSRWSAAHESRIESSRTQVEQALVAWEKEKATVEKWRETYGDKCRQLDELEDELEFVRGKEALMRSVSSAGEASSGSGDEVRKVAPVVLPPRPFEIDQNNTSLPLTPSKSTAALGLNRKKRPDQDGEGSDDGLFPIDHGDEDEDFIDRSGATGGSVVAALGRALTVRRNRAASQSRPESASTDARTGEGSGEQGWKVEKLMEDKNVKAALDFSKTKFTSLLSKVTGPQSGEERYIKTRKEVEVSEERYKLAVQALDSLRLTLEELLSTHLPYLQHCESDRLRAATSVLKSFHSVISNVPKSVVASHDRVQQTLDLVQTEKDLKLLIERRRTGSFQPRPIQFASHYSEPYTHAFGIDLRKFDETNLDKDGGAVPKVLRVLLAEIATRIGKVDDHDERRKCWIYETPLSNQHTLRSLLNTSSNLSLPESELSSLLESFDLPTLCSVVKLWLLELEVPVITFALYDELRASIPGRISGSSDGHGVDREGLVKTLGKLPSVHFETLRALLESVYPLVALEPTSDASDSRETYRSKLSLSLARPLIRPKHETALTLDDKLPSIVVRELLVGGEDLLKEIEAVAQKDREERYKARRQRTKPIDVRVSRTNLGLATRESVDLDQANAVLFHQQQQERLQQGLPSPPAPSAPEVPSKTALNVNTHDLAPPVPLVQQGSGQAYAASPLESASAFPKDQDVETPALAEAVKVEDEKPELSQLQRGEGPATETPFVPPVEDEDAPLNQAPAASTVTDEGADKPLSSSTSLKRSSVQSKREEGGTGASGASGRLRGARAPRPISSSTSSSILERAKAFEG
ncbi:GTPase-activating protein RGD2 [Sporobolomyces koalae]|uniref:GTPase-activating protein RGD2 n=1 Tax=Sporobolomyces koalae TaxID=500713 RepID=UPI00316BC51E